MTDRGAGDPQDLTDLVRRLRDGDSAAELRVRERVRRIAGFRGYGLSEDARLDIEQTVMLQLWQAVSRPDFRSQGFWGFVEVLTSRRCVDAYRGLRPELALEAAGAVEDRKPGPLDETLARERRDRGAAILERLSEPCRELIRQRVSENRTYSEIAEALKTSEQALRTRMHRCVQRARALLAELPSGPETKKIKERS
ncbi:MAG: RNA polymerase sigma factor [Thermoanaerobaculia bacterium]